MASLTLVSASDYSASHESGRGSSTVNGDGAQLSPKQRLLRALVPALCLALFAVQAVTSLVQESSTWDETCYIGLGKYLVQHRRWDVPGSILHPPLSFVIHSIPLLFVNTDTNLWKADPAKSNDINYLGTSLPWRGQDLLSSPANQGDRLLNASRLMMVLTALLLGCFVYAWSYSLYGYSGAILAVILFSFSPNILAHSRLITPDICITTFSFITVYYLWRLLTGRRLRDAIVGGLCLGFALLSKFTALLLLPICLVLIILWWLRGNSLRFRYCLLFFIIGIWVLYAGYCMNMNPYFAGIEYQKGRAAIGHPNFLMGHYAESGWWYFWIVVFLLKTPIPTMIFLAISAMLMLRQLASRRWLNEAFLLIPSAAIFGFFCFNGQAKGLRYILPIYPFLFVFAAGAAQWLLSRRLRAVACLAALTWYMASSFWIHPHYLAYFNELGGGPDNGYKYLVDSNLDWGQDLKGLKRFMLQHGISRINLSYFGSDSPERYGISYVPLPSFLLRDGDRRHHDSDPPGWFAISATSLQAVYFLDRDEFAQFKALKPVAKIGYSIFIYHINRRQASESPPPPAAPPQALPASP
jgi:hypothetical protein